MNNLSIRSASRNDSEFAYSVKKASFKEYIEKASGWDENEQRRLHEQRFATQDFRVITVDSADIGIIAVVVAPECVKLNQLFLLPEYRGRGIGNRCMLIIMEEAQQLHLPLRLRVLRVNPRALAFYERLGFIRSGEIDTHNLMEWNS
ncbi:MAG: GNAT family N-acetyltransferase [Deltaproteobacteria bacterium]|nr:GNAT family N-acetyltransferase [Deltaproteobacteria bacterium]